MKRILLILFSILYLAVGFVSTYHAIEFFSLSNQMWLGVILAIAFEIGQASVLFTLLTNPEKKVMPYILMIMLTCVQVIGNIYASYKYMMINNSDLLSYFTDSVLFFVKNPNPQHNYVLISYITGAILPIVALCMTGMVADLLPDSLKSQHILVNSSQETTNKENISNEIVNEEPVRNEYSSVTNEEPVRNEDSSVTNEEPVVKEEEKSRLIRPDNKKTYFL